MGHLDLGLNRPIHLDPAATLTIGAFPLVGGTASYFSPVPSEPTLTGLDLYFQGLSIDPGTASIHVSSSAQIWLR